MCSIGAPAPKTFLNLASMNVFDVLEFSGDDTVNSSVVVRLQEENPLRSFSDRLIAEVEQLPC